MRRGLRRDRAEEREALERAPPRRRLVPPQVVVDEHAVEAGRFGAPRDLDRDLGIVDERRQREPELHDADGRPGEHRGADRTGALAERGGNDRDLRPVLGPFEPLAERDEQAVEQQRPIDTSPPAITMRSGSRMFARFASPSATLSA